MKKIVWLVLVLLLAGCFGNQYTAIQQQDVANVGAEIDEVIVLDAAFAPPKVELTRDGVSDTSAIMPPETRAFIERQKFLYLARASIYSVMQEFGVTPAQIEYAKFLVTLRRYSDIADMAIKAKRQAGKSLVDKYSIQFFTVELKFLIGGLAIFGILSFLAVKYPAMLPLAKKGLALIQIIRTESPREIALDMAKAFGCDPGIAEEIVKARLNRKLTDNTTDAEKKKIKKAKVSMGLKTA